MNHSRLLKIILGIIIVLVIGNTVILGQFIMTFQDKLAEAEEMARPANLQIVKITDKTCEKCFSLDGMLAQVKKANVVIGKEENLDVSDPKAQEYIAKYAMAKIPSFIVTGETTKDESMVDAWEKMGKLEEETFIFTQTMPPYYDTASSTIQGLTDVIIIEDKTCDECSNGVLEKVVVGLGIAANSLKKVDISSSEGKELIAKYAIKKVPSMILSSEAEVYPSIQSIWGKLGSRTEEGEFILRTPEALQGIKSKSL